MGSQIRLFNGDSLVELKQLEDNSVDSVVTDPPYGLSFMGKKWDYDVPSVELWKEVYRVLKPGGHLLSFSGSRTYHKIASCIEEAGFEIRDMINWLYGSGMPKSMNIGKKVDYKQGNKREFVGMKRGQGNIPNDRGNWGLKPNTDVEVTKGNSKWEGWGTQLKPSNEPIVMARKPISEKTIVDNVLKWGVGGINIDKSRVGNEQEQSRFPTNTIHDGSYEVTSLFPNSKGAGGSTPQVKVTGYGDVIGKGVNDYLGGERKTFNSGDGSASRFFYCAKPSRNERELGLDNFQKKENAHASYGVDSDKGLIEKGRNPENRQREVANHHPTIKPIKLMEYLVNMVTPANGIVLDPFMGSGTTGIATVKNGFNFIGVEREEDYFKIAEARINYFANNKVELDYSEDETEEIEKPKTKSNKKITNSLF